MASFERSSRVGFTSSVSMLLEVSTTSMRSVPFLSTVSQCIPFCGRASATKPIATARAQTATRSQRRRPDARGARAEPSTLEQRERA